MRFVAFLALVGACGGLVSVDDAGLEEGGADASDATSVTDVVMIDVEVAADSSTNDATTVIDANADADLEAEADATNDAQLDQASASDALDAVSWDALADADASTEWALDLGVGQLFGVAVDHNLNILVGGTAGSSPRAFYVAELDQYGATRWSHSVAGSSTFLPYEAYDVAVDSQGNAYAAGWVGTALDLGAGPLGPGAVVVKYDSQGNFIWEYGPFSSTTFHRVRTLSNDDLVLVGGISGTQDYGGGSVVSAGGNDVVAVEISPSKTFIRAGTWGSAGEQYATALAVDSNNDVFMAGCFENTVDFGGGTMNGPPAGSGTCNAFVAKLDSSLGYLHQMNAQSGNGSIAALSTDATGNAFVAGTVGSTMSFGGATLTAAGNGDAVVAKLDPALGHLWSARYGDSSGQDTLSVATDPLGGATFSGFYSGTTDLGQGPLPPSLGFFVVGFDSTGTSTASFGGSSGNASAFGISYLSTPDFAVVGRCSGATSFPTGTLPCSLNFDAFVARMRP